MQRQPSMEEGRWEVQLRDRLLHWGPGCPFSRGPHLLSPILLTAQVAGPKGALRGCLGSSGRGDGRRSNSRQQEPHRLPGARAWQERNREILEAGLQLEGLDEGCTGLGGGVQVLEPQQRLRASMLGEQAQLWPSTVTTGKEMLTSGCVVRGPHVAKGTAYALPKWG